MEQIREYLWTRDTYPIKDSGTFLPNIVGYLQQDDKPHPAMLVVPGGGYYVVSPTESRLVADKFYAMGFHTFILTYTTNCGDMRSFLNMPMPALHTQPLTDISRAVACIRLHSKKWRVDPDHIAACGFSAGAHLTCSLAVHYHRDFLQKDLLSYEHTVFSPADRQTDSRNDIPAGKDTDTTMLNKPNAVILSYPVITSDARFRHEGSIKSLTGEQPSEEELTFFSLEKQVTAYTPPVFLWHTVTDDAVPVENSILFMNACRSSQIPCELHLFPEGPHGLSTADDLWQSGCFGEKSELCMEQFYTMLTEAAKEHPDQVPTLAAPLLADHADLAFFVSNWDEILAKYRGVSYPCSRNKDDAVAVWPTLAHSFLKRFGF